MHSHATVAQHLSQQRSILNNIARIMDSKTALFLLSVICVAFYPGSVEGRASCTLKWTWTGVNCSVVSQDILTQIQKWTDNTCPPGTELCGYKLISKTTTEVKATHTTPVHKYVDDLKMDFMDSTVNSASVCTVDGYSQSELWYAVLDDGTNYCNLHNLVTGAGLDKIYQFKEDTSDSDCTQYSSADCGKY